MAVDLRTQNHSRLHARWGLNTLPRHSFQAGCVSGQLFWNTTQYCNKHSVLHWRWSLRDLIRSKPQTFYGFQITISISWLDVVIDCVLGSHRGKRCQDPPTYSEFARKQVWKHVGWRGYHSAGGWVLPISYIKLEETFLALGHCRAARWGPFGGKNYPSYNIDKKAIEIYNRNYT